MSTHNFFGKITPHIEYIDVVRNNASDIYKVSFKVKDDPVTVIKWCRRNFGARGDGWDFSGAGKNVEVIIWSSKLRFMWEMWQE